MLGHQKHDHASPLHLRGLLHIADLCDSFCKIIENLAANLSAGQFTPAKTDGDLYLIAILQEFHGILQLCLQIMLLDIGRKANLFDVDDLLFLLRLFFPFDLLKTVLSIV